MSHKVAIVTDSTADIPEELIRKYGIHVVPLRVLFGEETYADGVELTPEEFYTKLGKAATLPTTSQPSPTEFMNVYQSLLDEDPERAIVSIHLSSGMSGTYQSALLGKSLLEREGDITVLDSKSASYGYGLLVVQAAELALQGKSAADIASAVEGMHRTRKLFFLVDTLEYLQKGGRIGKAAAIFGTLLNIKPILSIDKEGIIYAVEKVRGQKKAMARIIELFQQDFAGKRVNVAIGHTADPGSAIACAEQLRGHFTLNEVVYTNIGAVIGSHVGPGVIAIFMWPVPE
ncbi:EDD domain protein [Paenibacillus sp. Root52]|uniref:DegV family protein with EDD domain n=1 Tax=Paenibacillus amylolyticus TaxID=1451 RepID=A0AAP5H3P7_PAEAM|nr:MULTISPECIES: DegV family protein [Paenibacillus]KQY87586.1 EDD domain protein [Paenibacillus sp. Root52]MCG7375773.1 DegV family protein [Paenibacillus sp. ACRSA]MDR6725252.1 DegV family protein with EDD domain [Paenibacillus amylolyticus]